MRVSAAWRWLVGTLPENVMLFPTRPLVGDAELASRRFKRELKIHESLHNANSEGAALDSYWSLLCITILDVHERRRRYAILAAQLHRERVA